MTSVSVFKDIPVAAETRSCGTCTACCLVAEVKNNDATFNKPAWSKCQYACPSVSGSCSIFNEAKRPEVCSSFKCSWLRGYGAEEDRPDSSGMMVSVNEANGGRWIFAVETVEDSLFTTGKNIVMAVSEQVDVPVIVSKYNSRPPHDKGDLTVIKAVLLPRTEHMRGELIGFLDANETFGVYELITE